MFEYLDAMYLRFVAGLMGLTQELKEEEKGVATFVATVLLILMVVMLAALFWDQISDWFTNMLDKIFGISDGIGG